MMFSVFCPTHDSRVLLTRRNAISFWNGPDGPVLQWKCSCGHEGFLDHNGQTTDCVGCDADATAPVAHARA